MSESMVEEIKSTCPFAVVTLSVTGGKITEIVSKYTCKYLFCFNFNELKIQGTSVVVLWGVEIPAEKVSANFIYFLLLNGK